MNGSTALGAFIDNPDTLDFILERSEILMDYIKDNPYIVLTQILQDRYVEGYINRNNIDSIVKNLGGSYISTIPFVMGLLDIASLEGAGIYQVQQQPYLDLKGRGTLIGFVDTGIDYTKDIFKYEDGTSKIQFIYDKTVRGNVPEGFFTGTEYTNAQINEALKSENPYDIVPHKDTVGHGTFLASVAAGREDGSGFIGAAPDAELIIVKLKKARPYFTELYCVSPDQENVYESSGVMSGIEYIIKKARELDRPVAICLGIGTNLGSHDGFSLLEEYLSDISNIRGVCICSAAGNESQARHHFQNKLTESKEEQNIDIKVGDNAGSIFISLWNVASDRLSVSVRSPTGELVGRVPAISGTYYEQKLKLEKSLVSIAYYFPVEGSGAQLTRIRLINATPGIWTIIVRGDIVLDGTYHAWLPLTGLVSPNVEFLTPTPNVTVVVPATAFGIISCGAYDSNTNSLFIRSSWGPTRAPTIAPSLVAPGVNVGGVYPNGYGTMDGTSVSTAITAGASALLLQWGIVDQNEVAMSTYQIKAYLIRGCNRSENLNYPNPQWGFGSLNLMQTFNLMREM